MKVSIPDPQTQTNGFFSLFKNQYFNILKLSISMIQAATLNDRGSHLKQAIDFRWLFLFLQGFIEAATFEIKFYISLYSMSLFKSKFH